MSPFSTSSTLGLVHIAAGLALAAATVCVVIILIGIWSWVILPITEWATKPQGGLFKRIALWPVRKTAEGIQRLNREAIAAMSRFVAANAAPLVLMLAQLADVVQRLAGTLGDMSEQIHEALWTLRHETLPDAITAALIPIRAQLGRHTDRLDQLEDLNRGVAVAIGDTLRALPWGVPGGLVTNFQTLGDRFAQLWQHYWNTTRPQLNRVLDELIPELRRDLSDLAQRVAVGIDARLDALGARIATLERELTDFLSPRLDAMQQAIDALSEQIFGPVAGGLVALLERVGALELEVFTRIPERFAGLDDALARLRVELEQGIATGVAAFRERLEAVELAVGTLIPARLDAIEAAVNALAAEIFGEVGAGLVAIMQRLDALQGYVFGELREQVELQLGRIEGIETLLRENVLPRLAALEAMLEPVAFGALVLATMRRVAPNLFCRNVTRASEALCAQPDSFIDDLLAIGLPLLVLADICGLARLARGAAGLAVDALSPIVLGAGQALECGGDPPAAMLPLNLTDLPSTSAAVAL